MTLPPCTCWTARRWRRSDLSGKRVIDVGTGAGFPGMVLAILTPDARFTLLDSLGKRVDSPEGGPDGPGLKNVTCVHARAEEFAAQHREQFDLAASPCRGSAEHTV